MRADPRQFGERRETRLYGIATPMIKIVRPAPPTSIGLPAIPGGGCEFLACINEGTDAAAVFTTLGYTAATLSDRLLAEGWANRADVPLQDAQRALRLFRHSPEGRGLVRIGVLGNSAGALAIMHDDPVHTPRDAADQLSAQPDFASLIYPITTLELPFPHGGMRTHLLGKIPIPRWSPAGRPRGDWMHGPRHPSCCTAGTIPWCRWNAHGRGWRPARRRRFPSKRI